MTQYSTADLPSPSVLEYEHPPASDPAEAIRHILLGALEDPRRGIVLVDASGRVTYATARARERLGITIAHDVRGVALTELLSRFSFDANSIARALDGNGPPTFSLQAAEPDGSLVLQVRDLGHGYRAALLVPPTPDAEEPRPSRDNKTDPLTGLANRIRFEEATTAALARSNGGAVAVLMLDLDRFKAVNDTLGHAAGDALLCRVAERLQLVVRQTDLVSRFGGDEFAVLLASIQTPDQATDIAARILDLVQRSYLVEGHVANVGVSVGIAIAPDDGVDSRALLVAADLALYDAKGAGRATFRFFDPLMKQRAVDRRAYEMDLRSALALRQLEIFYQPQVSIAGRLVGFEALLRWRHPKRGIVPPSEFIPLAERIGAIVSIGDWVLRAAVKEALKWPNDVIVAVNVSPLQLKVADFAERVKRTLAEFGLPGHRLEIEITESMLINHPDDAIRILNELRGFGVRIAMDDFGTGYASLSQLALFPFDKIKVDRSLTGAEGLDVKKRAIVRAIAALGQSLGVSMLAEGVEVEHQLEQLASDGCSSLQGYLFGKPVPASELGSLIDRLYSPAVPDVE